MFDWLGKRSEIFFSSSSSYQVQTMNENLLLLQQYNMRQPSNQGQGQQGVAHSPAQMGFFLGHLPTGASYSPGMPLAFRTAERHFSERVFSSSSDVCTSSHIDHATATTTSYETTRTALQSIIQHDGN